MIFKCFSRQIPKPIEKSILKLYRDKLRHMERWRDTVRIDRTINDGQSVKLDSLQVENLQRYAYVAGEVAALEGIMERCFIDYSD